jgi:hypothetical protein
MKKLVLLAAFAGLLSSAAVAGTPGDDKGKKAKKECCKKGEAKACAGEKKEACSKGEAKACCKKTAETAEVKTTTSEEEKK